MKRELRLQFFKIVEAKHALGQNLPIRDPWAGKPAPQEAAAPAQHILNEQELFQAIKNVTGVRMIPGSYSYDDGTPPWGPEVSFKFEYKTAPANWATQNDKGDQNITNTIQTTLSSKYANLINTVFATYDGDNIYSVAITQKLQK
jgi:hypothetical protein